jgi:hypothetical protein
MSFSQFKLPHYLNVLMPLFALTIAQGITGMSLGFWKKLIVFSSVLLVEIYFIFSLGLMLVFDLNLLAAIFFFGAWMLLFYLQFSKKLNPFYLMIASALLFNALGFCHFLSKVARVSIRNSTL